MKETKIIRTAWKSLTHGKGSDDYLSLEGYVQGANDSKYRNEFLEKVSIRHVH